MFGAAWFGKPYYGRTYWGPGAGIIPPVPVVTPPYGRDGDGDTRRHNEALAHIQAEVNRRYREKVRNRRRLIALLLLNGP